MDFFYVSIFRRDWSIDWLIDWFFSDFFFLGVTSTPSTISLLLSALRGLRRESERTQHRPPARSVPIQRPDGDHQTERQPQEERPHYLPVPFDISVDGLGGEPLFHRAASQWIEVGPSAQPKDTHFAQRTQPARPG